MEKKERTKLLKKVGNRNVPLNILYIIHEKICYQIKMVQNKQQYFHKKRGNIRILIIEENRERKAEQERESACV